MESSDEVGNNVVPVEDVHSNSLHHTQPAENTAEKQNKPLISVVMPIYRLSKLITHSIRAVEKVLDANGCSYEIVVVDDGSPDDTYSQALTASRNPTVRVFRLPRNMGKGFALLYGFRKSRGDIVVFFDGDLDIDPRQIHLLVNTLRSNGVDIAITSKWHPQSRTIATPLRKFLSRAFYALTRLFLGLRVSDTQTGAKAFRRDVLEDIARHLTVKRYAFDVELLTAATARRYRIAEVPALWRIKLTSRFKTREIIKMLIDLMAVTYRHRVKRQYINSARR
ncbi:MAG: glycosyltransferase family 2 protein [Thermoprotei archaeon]|nr:MAG: glycosyltransferase family 2 protein [Thermoprotei archaeon]